jgi:hypothetical protein
MCTKHHRQPELKYIALDKQKARLKVMDGFIQRS